MFIFIALVDLDFFFLSYVCTSWAGYNMNCLLCGYVNDIAIGSEGRRLAKLIALKPLV